MSSADTFRVSGNQYFGSGQYAKAIECYSKAISLDCVNSIYFGNRAMCYLKLGKYGLAYNDSTKAIELDSNNLKARYVMGLSLLEMKQGKESFLAFSKALELARVQGSPFYEDIHSFYRKSRHLKWEEEERERVNEGSHILSYLRDLVNQDGCNKISQLEKKNQAMYQINSTLSNSASNDGSSSKMYDPKLSNGDAHMSTRPLDEEELETERQVIRTKTVSIIDNIKTVFAAADEHYRVRHVPEHFLCKITFEIMEDPVITPNGISYERKAIMEHFKKNGWTDPISRESLDPKSLYPNIGLRDAVKEFLSENEWAYDY